MSSESEVAATPTPLAITALLQRMIWSRGWDLAMRAVAVLFHGLLMLKQCIGLIKLFAARADHSLLFFTTAVVARLALIMFLSLIVLVMIVRLRPVAKASGVLPRLFALVGTCMPSFMTLLPRNPDSVAVNTVSLALLAIGSALAVYAFSYLNRSASIMPEARRLVTGGPYRFLRHPVYLFEEIGIIGLALPFASVWALLLLLLHIACQFQRMKNEERVLRGAFPEYDDYARRTARVIPGLY
ncbi:MAG TPA: isoprenylcysteine carboxylmethyltransferase family protein [Candidatus Angelobacter sp.]|nr:isoprenylcysteine carboxylmethyltransferase family protein [Candidatus Angelobacter sp.]